MYKNIIKEIYINVENEKNKDKNPRILDYVKAVIKYEDSNFFEKNNKDVIKTKIEQIRRSVAHALEVLKEEGVLDKIGNNYVPIDKARKHQSRSYLLENLKPARKTVIKVSKKVYVIPLNPKKVIRPTIPSENTHIESCSEIDKLHLEITMLKKQIESLTTKRDNIDIFFENLQNFIGHEYCGTVFNMKNNLIIVLDTDDKEEQNKIYRELNELLMDIEKSKPKISLIKKAED